MPVKVSLSGLIAVLALWLGLMAPASADDIRIQIRDRQAGLLRSPDVESEVIRVAVEGEEFTAVTTVGDFYLVRDDESGSFLYVPFIAAFELDIELPDNIKVSGQMPMPDQQDLSYWQVAPDQEDSDMDSNYKLRSKSRGMLTSHNGKKYPASYDYNTGYKTLINGAQLARDARRYLGAPYVSGGTTVKGIDCSGLTQVCLGKQGIDVVHRSSLQALEGRYVHHSDLRVGDLVFFRDDVDSRYLSHVGIYVGGGKFIHASQSRGGVVITSLKDKYFKSHYAFARRF